VILSGLWVGFVTLEKLQQSKWYPIPKAYKHQKNVSGCQFVPGKQSFQHPFVRNIYIFGDSEGEEAHWCGQLASNSALTNTIMALSA
jgi:hypothetical protein